MSDPYLSQIEAFPFNFAPRGWLQCNGQLLPINQNQALFSLLGTTYGGDGRVNFALPDLRGHLAVGQGQGPGLSNYILGEQTGQETVTITAANTPTHIHSVNANTAASGSVSMPSPTVVPSAGYTSISSSSTTTPVNIYSTDAPSVAMGQLSALAGGTPHNNLMPYLTLTYCICTSGVFPSRG